MTQVWKLYSGSWLMNADGTPPQRMAECVTTSRSSSHDITA
jgi:hypothetical protein